MKEIFTDAFTDSVRLIPFLFFTYLVMEYLEHRAGEKTVTLVKKAGRFGPLIGGILGAVPQCGFSVAASGLYAGRVITPGTLLAIYLSTSDEMLPVLISGRQSPSLIAAILTSKILIGMLAGFSVDLLASERKRRKERERKGAGMDFHTGALEEGAGQKIHEMCEKEHCSCEQGVFLSACRHTLQIAFFIFLVNLGLQFALFFAGGEALTGLMLNRPVLGPVIAGLVGLIPNCASSVAITNLFINGMLETGAMMAGLLTGAGTGVLVLFRTNRNRIENIKILALLYGIGVFAGIVIDFII